jgi:hypothetical protein
LLLAASYGDIPRMAFARRPVAEQAGLNRLLLRRSRIYGSNSRYKNGIS